MLLFRKAVVGLLIAIFPVFAFAQTEPPQFVTVDGRLYDSTNPTAPLLDANVAMRIQILNPAKTCILYEEQQSVSTLVNGFFNARVGSPTAGMDSLKRTGLDSGNAMSLVFQNQNLPIAGQTSGGLGCSYTPAPGESRYFRFIVTPSTTGVTSTLSPDMTIDSVPQSLVAETLQGFASDDFLQINANVTQAKADSLFGGSYASLTSLLSGTSTLYLQNTANGTVIPSRPSDPVAPSAGQIWYDSVTNELKYYDGTAVQALSSGSADPTKLPLAGGLMSGAINMGSNDITSVGHITQSAQRTLRFGGYTGGQETTLLGTLIPGQEGTTWYNTTTDKLMYFDGTASQELLTSTSANSLVPNCSATQSLQMSAGPIYVWSCVATTDSTKLALAGGVMTGALTMNAQNQVRFADADSSNFAAVQAPTTISSDYILTLPVDNGTPGQVLQTDGNGILSWLSIPSAPVTSVFGRTGVVVAATSDYDANQIDNTPAGTISATDVQAALNELDTEKAIVARNIGTAADSGLSGGGNLSADRNLVVDITGTTAEAAVAGADEILIWDVSAGALRKMTRTNFVLSEAEVDAMVANNGYAVAADYVAKAGDTMTGQLTMTNNITLNAQNQTRYADSDSSNYAAIQSPAALGANYVLTLPINDGGAGEVLSTDGNGILSWIAIPSAPVTSVFGRTGVVVAAASDYDANQIDNTPAGTISATDVQAALNELDTEKAIVARNIGTGANSGLSGGGNLSADRNLVVDITGTTALGTAADNADEVLIYDASGTVLRKVTRAQLNLSETEVDAMVANNGYAADADKVNRAGDTMTGALNLDNEQELRLSEADGSGVNYVAIKSPTTLGANYTLTLPVNDGNNGQYLQTDGNGVLSWVTPAGVGETNTASNVTGSTGVGLFKQKSTFDLEFKSLLPGSTKLSVTGGADDVTLDVVEANIVHDNLSGFVANEHIDHSAVNIATGANSGLAGGGDITATRNLAVDIAGTTALGAAADNADEVLIYDASGTALRKVTRAQLNLSEAEVDAFVANNGYATATDYVAKAGDTMTGQLTMTNNITLNAQNQTRYADSDSSNYAAIQSPAALGANYVLTLPINDGGVGEVLSTDGNGVLSWIAIPSAPVTSVFGRTGIVVAATSDYDANQIDNTPAGNISATDVQTALNELDTEKAITTRNINTAANSGLAGGGNLSADRNLTVDITGTTALGAAADNADEILIYDSSGTALRKVTRAQLNLSETEVDAMVANNGYLSAEADTLATVTARGANTATSMTMNTQAQMQFADAAGGEYAAIRAPATIATNYVLTLPVDDGTSGQLLSTDGNGVLSWVSAGGGGDFLANGTVPMTGNLRLNGNWISNDGGNEGIRIDNNGRVGVGAPASTNSAFYVNGQVEVNQSIWLNGSDGTGLYTTNDAISIAADTDNNGAGNLIEFLGNGTLQSYFDNLGNLNLVSENEIRLQDTAGGQYIGFRAPATVASSVLFTLPNADGSPGQFLQTNGSAALTWATPSMTVADDSLNFDKFADALVLDASTDISATGTNVLSVTNTGTGSSFRVNDQASDTTPFIIDDAGNVGIGTTSPMGNLDVNGGTQYLQGTSATLNIRDTDSALGTNQSALLLFRDSINNISGRIGFNTQRNFTLENLDSSGDIRIRNNGDIRLESGGTEKFRLIATGEVGIGTTVPGTLLDVAGAITSRPSGAGTGQTGQIIMRELAAGGTETATIRAPDALGASYALTLPVDDGTSGQVLSTDGNGVLSWIAPGASIAADSLNFTDLADALVLDASTDISATGTNVLSITNSGTGNSFRVNDEAGDVSPFVIDASGNVGIGTTSPNAPLEVVGASASQLQLFNVINTQAAASGVGPRMGFQGSGANNMAFISARWQAAANTDADLTFSTRAAGTVTEKMRIEAGGYVGIGTTVPGTVLDVAGAITARPSGTGTGQSGQIIMRELAAGGTDTATIRAPDALGASYALTLPVDDGTSGQVLSTDGNGVLSWIAPGASIAADSLNFTDLADALVLDASTDISATGANALSITNSGTGASFRVNDAAGDTTPFIITDTGSVGVGTTTPTGRFSVGSAAGENAYFFYDNANIGNTVDGQSFYIYRRAAEGSSYMRFFTDQYMDNIFESSEDLFIDTSGLEQIHLNAISGAGTVVGGNLLVGQGWSAPFNPTIRHAGRITEAAGAMKFIEYQVNDTTNNYELSREDSNISAFDIKLPTLFTGGNVGIGTTIPGTLLDVAGAITSRPFGTGAGETGQLIMRELAANGTNTATIRVPDVLGANYVLTLPADDGTSGQVLSTDGNGVLSWIAAGGTPAADSLNFTELADALVLDASTDISATGTNALSITNSGTGASFRVNDVAADTTPFIIDDAGNVGIGTTAPSSTLQVNGIVTAAAGSQGAPTYTFAGDPDTGMYSDTTNTLKFAVGGAQAMALNPVASAVNYVVITPSATGAAPTITTAGSDTAGRSLTIQNGTSSTGAGGALTLRGGGTTNPGSGGGTLSIIGGSGGGGGGAGGFVSIAGGSASGDGVGGAISIASAVGAGFNRSGGTLSLSSGASTGTANGAMVSITAGNGGATNGDGGEIRLNGGNGGGAGARGYVNLQTSGGNVGIGTTIPGTLLDVAGAITSRPFGTGAGQAGQLILRELAGNGTNTVTIRSPDSNAANYVLTLPVDDGTTGQVLQTNGSGVLSWVTVGGGGALNDLSDAVTDATAESVYVGSGAGAAALSTNQYNVALGHNALASLNNVNADRNTAIGWSAMGSSTTGQNNTALGAETMPGVSGDSNVAIGREALNRLTSGARNTSVGTTTLFEIDGESDNVAMGEFAGVFLNGNGNTMLGKGSMSSGGAYVGDADRNTAVGMNGLTGITSGDANVSLGTENLQGVTTGSNNIAVGSYTGGTLTTGSNNILLGHNINVPAAATSNFMSLGNIIYATGVNGTGTTISAANVGVGTSAPSNRLHARIADAATNTTTSLLRLEHESTGTPAADFGTGLLFTGESSTTVNQDMAQISSIWTTATHASRASALAFSTLTGGGSLTERMRINGDGSIGIGNSGANVRVAITGGLRIDNSDQSNGTTWENGLSFGGGSGEGITSRRTAGGNQYGLDLFTGSTMRLSITSGGNVGVGTTGPNRRFEVVDSQAANTVARFENTSTGASSSGIEIEIGPTTNPGTTNDFIQFKDGDGTVIGQVEGNGAGAVAYNTASDRRLKDNIRNTRYGLKDILNIQVRDYNYKTSTKDVTGFIAQELYEVYPGAVSRPEDENQEMWGVDYSQMTPILVKGLQDLYGMCKMDKEQLEKITLQHGRDIASLNKDSIEKEKEIEKLKKEIEQQKKENAEIKARLEKIEKMLLKNN